MTSPNLHNYSIRPVELPDLEALIALRLEALHSSPTAFGADYAQTKDQPQSYWLNRFMVEVNEGLVVVAEAGDELVGVAGISRRMSPKAMHAASIWGVYVRPAWRGQRIAEALLEACFDWARSQSVVIVKLAVVTENLPAIKSYQRMGFVTYGTEPKAIFYDGRYYDEYLMYKDVG
jgi:RimJ/RimL family protein N-acetyltransferase